MKLAFAALWWQWHFTPHFALQWSCVMKLKKRAEKKSKLVNFIEWNLSECLDSISMQLYSLLLFLPWKSSTYLAMNSRHSTPEMCCILPKENLLCWLLPEKRIKKHTQFHYRLLNSTRIIIFLHFLMNLSSTMHFIQHSNFYLILTAASPSTSSTTSAVVMEQ